MWRWALRDEAKKNLTEGIQVFIRNAVGMTWFYRRKQICM